MVNTLALTTILASVAPSLAAIKGFNYGSTYTTGQAKQVADFQPEFSAAQSLAGAPGFDSARLYTMVQAGTANTPISAIQAAINSGSTVLLGMWASGGQDGFNNELAALKSAISMFGSQLKATAVGLSIGSEDLYRITPTGIAANSGAGADPATLTNYISQVRSAISGTALEGIPIGHVDTWTAWVNGSNNAVIEAVDWLGVDAYPYFQDADANSIDNSPALFWQAYDNTVGVAQNKAVWITETGFPLSGPTMNQAVPSVANAKTYWDQVYCEAVSRNINTYWFTLRDADPQTPSPSFGLVPSNSYTPYFDLTCPAVVSSSALPASATSGAGSSASVVAASTATNNAVSSSAGSGPIVVSTGTSPSVAPQSSSSAPAPSSTASSPTPSGSILGVGPVVSVAPTSSSGAAAVTTPASTMITSSAAAGQTSAPASTSTGVLSGAAGSYGSSSMGLMGALVALIALF